MDFKWIEFGYQDESKMVLVAVVVTVGGGCGGNTCMCACGGNICMRAF